MTRRGLLALLLFAALLGPHPAAACFGPKLYLAAPGGVQGDVLFELVALYLKEKTGIETVRVALQGETPVAALQGDRADLAFDTAAAGTIALAVDGVPYLLAGRRPAEDLQFTTALPALRKLGGLLTALDVSKLVAAVENGASPAAAARRLLGERGWI